MTERARIWQRVSTGGQDEASQLPDLITWCDSHGYDYSLDERYVIHGKSAYSGKHDKYLDQAIQDMAAGQYTVLIVWASSRIERRGAYNAFDLARRVREAGGRIEYVKDAYLNETNDMSDVMLALAATKDRQESKDKSDRTLAKQSALRAAGSVVGRVPWGYEIRQRGNVKVLVPTAIGRKYIPLIFQAVIDGKSLRDVAAWLDSEHVPTTNGRRWNEFFIGTRLIKNPTYYGQRPNAGQLDTEALVSPTTWQEAQAAIQSRVRPGRGTVKHEKVMLAPVCGACYGQPREGCPSGVSPMYRVFSQFKDGKRPFYRCTGHGPQRKGCGAPMISVVYLDLAVKAAILGDNTPHNGRVFVPGDDRSDDIGRLRERGAGEFRKGNYTEAAKLGEEAKRLEDMPRVAPHWEEKYAGQSNAQYFASLSEDERREYLATQEIRVRREDDGKLDLQIFPRWLDPA